MNVLVSMIIPIYNSSSYLKECLDSVLGQSLKNIEVLCINDGSTDDSLNLLQKYREKDKRIKIYNQKNQGAGAARNTGLKMATDKYVAFMDPDDFYPDNNVLMELYETIEKYKVKIAGGGLIEFLPDKRYRKEYGDNDPKVFQRNGFLEYSDYQYDYFFQRFIYSRKFLIENNIGFPLHKRQQDILFFIKAMLKAKIFYTLTRRTYCYRVDYKLNPLTKGKIEELLDITMQLLEISKNNNFKKLYKRILKRYIFQRFERFLIKVGLNSTQFFIRKLAFELRFKIFLNKHFKGNIEFKSKE